MKVDLSHHSLSPSLGSFNPSLMKQKSTREGGQEPLSQKGHAKQLDYQKPLGESGTDVKAATRANSLIQVYAFESQHKAAQRGQAERQGVEVDVQKTTIKVAVDETGRPIAIGGETSSEFESSEGHKVKVNELALLSEFVSGKKSASASFFGDSRNNLPQFFLFDSFMSRLNIENDRRTLSRNSGIVVNAIENSQMADRAKMESLNQLEEKVNELKNEVTFFGNLSPLNNKVVTVRIGSIFDARATSSNTEENSYEVEVISKARAQEVAFDVVGNDDDALGVEGQFYLNGIKHEIKATDNLIDLRNIINLGEDVNANGHLDNTEDLNSNNQLDPGEDTNGNGLLDTDEDVNGNGILDSGEDLNYNGLLDLSEDRDYDRELDLGTEKSGVKAFVIDNQLILKATEPNGRVDYLDEDGILETLGLIEEDSISGGKIFKNEIFAGSKAVIEVDGERFESDTNTFTDAIEGVHIDINSHLQKIIDLEVVTDATSLLSSFEDVVGAFNFLQSELNALLSPGDLFTQNDHIQDIKTESHTDFQLNEPPPYDVRAGLETLGLAQKEQRVLLDELSITQASLRQKMDNLSIFDRSFGVPTTVNSIDHLGLSGNEDGFIEIDEKTLEQNLEENIEEVDEKLGPEGFMGRLDGTIDRTLKGGGHLFLTRSAFEGQTSAGELIDNFLGQSTRRDLVGLKVNLIA